MSKTADPTAQNLTWLRVVRELRGLTQSKLAAAAGLSRVSVSHLENGHVEPNLRTMRALAKVLDVKPDQLFPDDDEPVPADVLAAHLGLGRNGTRRNGRRR
jgi:transcriptional regulator with XRE-family HTH domain